jgi:hypothetical protein
MAETIIETIEPQGLLNHAIVVVYNTIIKVKVLTTGGIPI